MTDIFAEMERDAVALKHVPTDAEAKSIATLAREMVGIDDRLLRYAEVAKGLTERRMAIAMKELPDMMEAAGQDKIGLPESNCDLVLDEYYKAGLPNPDTVKEQSEKDRLALLRQEGIDWLTKDSPDILQTTVTVSLPKGSLETAGLIRSTLLAGSEGIAIVLPPEMADFARELYGQLTSEQGYNIPPESVQLIGAGGFGIDAGRVTLDEGVHWATLTSFVKEQVGGRKRVDLPLEALGATVGRIVKIVKRKTR